MNKAKLIIFCIFVMMVIELVIWLYVDDLLIYGSDKQEENFEKGLKAHFEIKDIGLVKKYLSTQIEREK